MFTRWKSTYLVFSSQKKYKQFFKLIVNTTKARTLDRNPEFPCIYVIIEKYLTSEYKDTERKEGKDIVNIIQTTQ